MSELEAKLSLINEWVSIASELITSSVCSIKVTDPDARDRYTSCSNKQAAIDPYSESFDILDIVHIKNTTSNMMLREIVGADSMIFSSEIQLYGDWSTSKSEDHMIVSMPASAQEETGDEYDVGMKSSISVNHILDFMSIQGSASGVSNQISKTICKEFGITDEKSQRMQIILREFSEINSYPQICQHYSDVKSTYSKDQDKEGEDQPSIYESGPDQGSEPQYTETKVYTSKTASGIEELVYVYSEDPKTVQESQIKHSYAGKVKGDDEDLLGLDQRLISAYQEQQDLSKLNDEQIAEKERQDEIEDQIETQQAYEQAKIIEDIQEYHDQNNQQFEEQKQEEVKSSNESRIDSLQALKTRSPQDSSQPQENTEVAEEPVENQPVFEETTHVEPEVYDESSPQEPQSESETEEPEQTEPESEEDSIDASTSQETSEVTSEEATIETSSEPQEEQSDSSEISQEITQEQA